MNAICGTAMRSATHGALWDNACPCRSRMRKNARRMMERWNSLPPAPCGDSEQTVRFLKSLRRRVQGRPMLLLWDGVSYHRSACVQAYLQQINGSRPEEEWRIHCLTFAPNAPQQQPIEEVWLAGKTAVRQAWQTGRHVYRCQKSVPTAY